MPNKPLKLEFLFGKHKFLQNARKNLNIRAGPLLACVILEKKIVAVNLTDTYHYCKAMHVPFDRVFANMMAHEVLHLEIFKEGLSNGEQEERIIEKVVSFQTARGG